MDSYNNLAEANRLADQAQRFSAFTGLIRPNANDMFFLVMGATGSGKSSFVAQCTGQDVTIGHGLHSCTSGIGIYDLVDNGRRIYLIDTPGFNDTTRSDMDTLAVLAAYLGTSYANRVYIHGIIMLHPISSNRMAGSSLRNIDMMKSMCGFSRYNRVAIVTTMWPATSRDDDDMNVGNNSIAQGSNTSNDAEVLWDRELELLADPRFFRELLNKGATNFRHNEHGSPDPVQQAASARRIVKHLVGQAENTARYANSAGILVVPEPLMIQREMVDQGKALGDTAAGVAVDGALHKLRLEHERRLYELGNELKSELAQSDAAYRDTIQELKQKTEQKLEQAQRQKRALRKRIRDLQADEQRAVEERMTRIQNRFRDRLAKKEEELQAMEEELRSARRKIMARRREAKRHHQEEEQHAAHCIHRHNSSNIRQQKKTVVTMDQTQLQVSKIEKAEREEVAALEKTVNETREEVTQTRTAYEVVQKKTGNIRNGLANGVAAGITSGTIAAIAAGAMCQVM